MIQLQGRWKVPRETTLTGRWRESRSQERLLQGNLNLASSPSKGAGGDIQRKGSESVESLQVQSMDIVKDQAGTPGSFKKFIFTPRV